MSSDAWVVLFVVVAVLGVAASGRLTTVLAMGSGLVVLLVSGTIDDDVALSGLAASAPVTIAALYVVAGAVTATGAMAWVVDRVFLGHAVSLWRLAGSTAAVSAFIPNTPLVAFTAPRVISSCRLHGRSASRLLMPLSFASILGGVITLLGTSTNLVVSDALAAAGQEPLGVFEVTPVGLPVAVAGVLVLVVVAPRLLREREPAGESMRRSFRSFQLQMVVESDGPLVGSTVAEAGLRDLPGLFLAAIERDDVVAAAAPSWRLAAGDRLHFVGDVRGVVELQDRAGLQSAERPHLVDAEGAGVRLYEAVVAPGSELAGSTLRAVGFRSRYAGAVVAVHRADAELLGKLGRLHLAPGDVLLVLAGPDFEERWRDHADFSLVASVAAPPPLRRSRALIAAVATVGLVVAAATELLDLLQASILAAVVVVVGGALSVSEARHAIDLDVVLTVALSISIGNAAASSGLADELALGLLEIGEPLGASLLLGLIVVITQLVTELLSNSGAAALMVPIAIGSAAAVGGDPRAFALGVLVGASCSFLTPIGYQTNLMVYGLGGYRFGDFTRLGLPLTIVVAIVATIALA